ncbi:MAG TPA: alpha/beta fold hydrolase [Stellaceae bacterium]|nr:alpha/beta fold hydrolase [Stellaceae bacterium]
MASFEERPVRLWQGGIETEIEIGGSGPPLVYFHGPWGLRHDRAFIASLAATHRVYAPKHPGTGRTDHEAAHKIDNWLDLMVYYDELLDVLGLERVALVGHSFGGLVAAELAATFRARAARLVLIDPVGLWRDDLPVTNWMVLEEGKRLRALFADPAGAAAKRFSVPPDDAAARVAAQVEFVWAQACTGKLVWPIPDKGLKKHLHRVAAPTLIIWGKEDGIINRAYAGEFASRIAGSRVELVDGAAHMPHLEAPETVARLVRGFLEG